MKQTAHWLVALVATAVLAAVSVTSTFAQDTQPATVGKALPLSSAAAAGYQSYDFHREAARQQIRDRVRFEAEQRMLRAQWNESIGYAPNRPLVNGSYMSSGVQYYYLPSRGQIVTNGLGRSGYW